MKRRVTASLLLAGGFLLQLLYPARMEEMIARNYLYPEVNLLTPPLSCVMSSVHLLIVLLAYAVAGILMFELAKLIIAGSWQRSAIIALAQIALPIDCVRAYAWDWWFYFTGIRSAGQHQPVYAAFFTLAAIAAVWWPSKVVSRTM